MRDDSVTTLMQTGHWIQSMTVSMVAHMATCSTHVPMAALNTVFVVTKALALTGMQQDTKVPQEVFPCYPHMGFIDFIMVC